MTNQVKKVTQKSDVSVAEAPTFSLPNRAIKVVLIKRENKFISEQKTKINPFKNGLGDNSTIGYELPLRSTGGFISPFTSIEEQHFIETALGYPKGAMSVDKRENNFWRNYRLRLGKLDQRWDLSDPEDYLKYIVSLTMRDLICPEDGNPRDRSGTYRYQLIDESKEENRAIESITFTQEAYMEFGKIKDNAQLLRYVLIEKEGGSRLPVGQSSITWLVTQVNEFIQDDSRSFLNIVKKKNLELRAWLHEAVKVNVLDRISGLFYTKDGKPLALKDRKADMDGAIEFLLEDDNQELYLTLQEQVQKSKE
jgi:hypothetical protein